MPLPTLVQNCQIKPTAYDKLIDKEIYRRSTVQQNENKSSYTADMNRIKIYYYDVCYLLYCFDQLNFSSVFLSHKTLLSFETD